MARQVEGSLPAPELTDERPGPSADPLRKLGHAGLAVRPEPSDALDRSIEALRETLEFAEARWRQLESRLADRDRVIRELQDELFRAHSDRNAMADSGASHVPELTEIVTSVAAAPGTRDA